MNKKAAVAKRLLPDSDKKKIDKALAPKKAQPVQLDAGYYYEAIHTAHLSQEFINDHLYQHPFIEQHMDLAQQANKAMYELGKLYKMISEKADQYT